MEAALKLVACCSTAPPVPSSCDTALTIASDKNHVGFVELLLQRDNQAVVKKKKGNSPFWLAANCGHLEVVELFYKAKADIDSQASNFLSIHTYLINNSKWIERLMLSNCIASFCFLFCLPSFISPGQP